MASPGRRGFAVQSSSTSGSNPEAGQTSKGGSYFHHRIGAKVGSCAHGAPCPYGRFRVSGKIHPATASLRLICIAAQGAAPAAVPSTSFVSPPGILPKSLRAEALTEVSFSRNASAHHPRISRPHGMFRLLSAVFAVQMRSPLCKRPRHE